MTEGGDDVDIDASEWIYRYPSSETVFWNDIDMLIINDKNKNKITSRIPHSIRSSKTIYQV